MYNQAIVVKLLRNLLILLLACTCSVAQSAQPVVTEHTKLLPPRAEPYALQVGSGKVAVIFYVTRLDHGKAKIYLRRTDQRVGVLMNDLGRAGDRQANDGVYAARITVDTTSFKPDSYLSA